MSNPVTYWGCWGVLWSRWCRLHDPPHRRGAARDIWSGAPWWRTRLALSQFPRPVSRDITWPVSVWPVTPSTHLDLILPNGPQDGSRREHVREHYKEDLTCPDQSLGICQLPGYCAGTSPGRVLIKLTGISKHIDQTCIDLGKTFR